MLKSNRFNVFSAGFSFEELHHGHIRGNGQLSQIDTIPSPIKYNSSISGSSVVELSKNGRGLAHHYHVRRAMSYAELGVLHGDPDAHHNLFQESRSMLEALNGTIVTAKTSKTKSSKKKPKAKKTKKKPKAKKAKKKPKAAKKKNRCSKKKPTCFRDLCTKSTLNCNKNGKWVCKHEPKVCQDGFSCKF